MSLDDALDELAKKAELKKVQAKAKIKQENKIWPESDASPGADPNNQPK